MKKMTKSKLKAAEAAFALYGPAALAAFALLLCVPAWADMKKPDPKNASRPMSEMEGGCDNFKMPLATEMALWDKAELRVQGAQDDKSTTELPSNRKITLRLYPQKKVILPAKPENDFSKGQTGFAGLATMEVKKDGLYHVALGSKVWLDLVEVEIGETTMAKIIPATSFEMQTGCTKIFKAVEYKLQAGKKYLLQVSSSAAPSVQILTNFVRN